jgi:hypothetical protein
MEGFRIFALAMDFVAVGVLERELHKMIGLASWRLAQHADCEVEPVAMRISARADLLRKRALRPCLPRSSERLVPLLDDNAA